MTANLALLGFLTGEEPCLREFQAQGVIDPEAIMPDEAGVIRSLTTPQARCVLAVGDGWTGTITANLGRTASIQVTAVSDELAEIVCKQITAKVPPPPKSPGRVPMIFWHLGSNGARHAPRETEAPTWASIRPNYPSRARDALGRLISSSAPDAGGRLVLLHGEPGTGKTTLVRALARVWAPWCRADYIVDADRLFGSPSYLLDVLTNHHVPMPGAGTQARPWRLLIIEDGDELIRADAKHATGQSLSRLLNVTDGMVGQGLKVLVCITTNEDLHRLHRAVHRRGRCLANIAVGRFDQSEAAAWLGGSGQAGGRCDSRRAERRPRQPRTRPGNHDGPTSWPVSVGTQVDTPGRRPRPVPARSAPEKGSRRGGQPRGRCVLPRTSGCGTG